MAVLQRSREDVPLVILSREAEAYMRLFFPDLIEA